MHSARRLAVLGITVLCLYLLSSGSPGERLRQAAAAGIEAGRMKNVTVEAEPLPTAPPAPAAVTADGPAWIAEAEEADGVLVQVMESVNADEIREILRKYCAFLPVAVYLEDENAPEPEEGKEKPEPKPGPKADEEALSEALNAEGSSLRFYNSEDSAVWPMVPTEKDGRKGVMTTNKQVDNSTSSIYLAVNAAEGDVLSFDYSMSAHAYKTRLTILIDGEGVKCFNGMHDWTGWSIELPAGEHEICFRYTKNTFTEGEDTVWLSNMRIESGDDAQKALASLPSYPSGDRLGAEMLAQGARHVIVESDSPDLVTGMESTDSFNYYMLPEESGPITMRVTLTEDMDPGAAFIANFVARTVTAYENTLTEDRGDYIYTTDPALLRDGFTYIVCEYDPPNDAAPTTCTTFITYSEEILDEILRSNGESMGVTFTWHYDE